MKTTHASLALALALASFVPGIASSQSASISVRDPLWPSETPTTIFFGRAVAAGDGGLLVGDYGNDVNGHRSGCAYVFDAGTGQQRAKLVPDDGAEFDEFGYSVAISGTVALVGSHQHDGDGPSSGAVYLFDTTTGAQLAKLQPINGEAGDRFGVDVAIDGEIAVVAASNSGQGSADIYVFDTVTGEQTVQLTPDGDADLGTAVAIHGTTVLVGAIDESDNGPQSGAAYLFDATTGLQTARLVPGDGAGQDLFGAAVAIDNDLILIGAWGDGVAGSVYVFDAANGAQLAKLRPQDSGTAFSFGHDVELDNGIALISGGGGGSGNMAYLFDVRTERQIARIVPPVFTGSLPVALHGTTAVLGTPSPIAGTAYRFSYAPSIRSRTAGTNPSSLTASGSWTGSQLTFEVDLSTTGHSHALIFGFDGPVETLLGGGQTLLCEDVMGNGALIATGFREGPIASFDVPVPSVPELVGIELYTQALHAGGAFPFALSNAQDLVVGGCPFPQKWTHKLLASDGSTGDEFGTAVATDGETVLVGARRDDDNGGDAGSAYVLDAETGVTIAKLLPTDGDVEDRFGSTVAIDGGIAIVGAVQDDDDGQSSGSAYLFDAESGVQIAKLLPNDGGPGDRFGIDVDIAGPTAIVGRHQDDPNGTNSGSAYLFDTATGTQFAKLVPADGAANDRFGHRVALEGQIAVIGAHRDDDNGSDSGSVYVFDAVTGAQIRKLLASDGVAGDQFGSAIAVDAGIAVIGASGRDDNGFRSGAAYLFDIATGVEIAKLLAPDGDTEDGFGSAVAVRGNTVVVGAPGNRAAYVFDVPTGQLTQQLFASCDATELGSAVAIAGSDALLGAPADTLLGADSGSVFAFPLTERPRQFREITR